MPQNLDHWHPPLIVDKTWFKCSDIGCLFTCLSGYRMLLLLRCWDIGYWALAASGHWTLSHSKQSNIQRLGLTHASDFLFICSPASQMLPVTFVPLQAQSHHRIHTLVDRHFERRWNTFTKSFSLGISWRLPTRKLRFPKGSRARD